MPTIASPMPVFPDAFALAQDFGFVAREVHDRRRHIVADAAVDHQRHIAAVPLVDQFGIRGVFDHFVVVLHRGGDKRTSQRRDDSPRNGVAGNTDSDRTPFFERLVGHARRCRQYERERPRQTMHWHMISAS